MFDHVSCQSPRRCPWLHPLGLVSRGGFTHTRCAPSVVHAVYGRRCMRGEWRVLTHSVDIGGPPNNLRCPGIGKTSGSTSVATPGGA